MKLIGLDVGTKRIGVAKADTSTKIAVPDGFISVNGQEFSEIARLARLYNTNIFVIGLPRSNQGNETQQSAYVRNFARELGQVIPNSKVYFQDETLTSVEAEKRLKARKKHYQKGEIDAEAASIILQDCIERMATMKKTTPSRAKATDPADFTGAANIPFEGGSTTDTAQIVKEEPKMRTSKNHKAIRIVCTILAVLLVLGGLGVGGFFLWYNNMLGAPVADVTCKYTTAEEQANATEEIPESCKFIRFSVTAEPIAQIASNLQAAGLIKSDFAFTVFIRLNEDGRQIQAGDYDFRPTMTTADIVEAMKNGSVVSNTFNFTILPGSTIADIKASLLAIGYTEEEINPAFEKHYDSAVLKGLYDVNGALTNSAQPIPVQLEGYIFGETYQFYNGEKVENILKRAILELNERVIGNDLEAKFEKQGLSLREGIILASIVQKEAKSDDMAGVAQVFLNRLRLGMSLGSDVTATYAADIIDPNRETLTDNALILAHDSLYNTRMHTGLTPGPISQPSITALLAVAEPDQTHRHDLYFLTGDDGKMYYSDSEQGHQQNARDYCQKLCLVAL